MQFNKCLGKAFLCFAISNAAVLFAQTPAAPIIRVTLLGTGVPLLDPAAYVSSGRVTAGLMVEAGPERMLFDVGQGIVTRLLQAGGSPANPYIAINRVFISHLHSDHIVDLPALYAYGWLFRDDQPLMVFGPGSGPNQPVGTTAVMPLLRVAFQNDFYLRCCGFTDPDEVYSQGGFAVGATELFEGPVYSSNGVTVTAFLVDHRPVQPAFGFRVDYQGHSVVFSGDTRYSDNLVKNSMGVDVLIHEVYGFARNTGPQIYDYHTPPEDAARVFNNTKPKMAVYTHMAIPPGSTSADIISRTRAAGYAGPLMAGSDLLKIDVGAAGVTLTPYAPQEIERPATSVPAELLDGMPRRHRKFQVLK